MSADPKWIIEKDNFWEGQPDVLTPELEAQKTDYQFVQYIPFQDAQSETIKYSDNECVICYGSLNFINGLRTKAKWTPSFWYETKQFLCSTYYAYMGKYLLNDKHCFVTLNELKRNKQFFFQTFGKNNSIFIRPDSGNKQFTGHVAWMSDFEDKLDKLSYGQLGPDLLIVVSEPKTVYREYRFVVCDRKIVSGCTYNVNGKHQEESMVDGKAWKLAEKIANEEWRPDIVYAIDIAETEDGYKLLEVNAFNCAGFYAGHMPSIICEVNRVALKQWKEVNAT